MGDAIFGNARPQRDHAGDIGGLGRGDVARDDFIDRCRIEVEAFQKLADNQPAEFLHGDDIEHGGRLDEGGAHPSDDNRLSHF